MMPVEMGLVTVLGPSLFDTGGLMVARLVSSNRTWSRKMSKLSPVRQLQQDAQRLCTKVSADLKDIYTESGLDQAVGNELIMEKIKQRRMVLMVTGPDFQPYLVGVDEGLRDYIEVM